MVTLSLEILIVYTAIAIKRPKKAGRELVIRLCRKAFERERYRKRKNGERLEDL